jgi:putative hydrolase of the HAD superfamily
MQEKKSPGAYAALIFDMDNTLFDLVAAQVASCHAVTESLNRDDGDALFEYFLRPLHGFESHENIREYLEDRAISADGTFDLACRIYDTEKLRYIVCYDGVRETLQALLSRGYPLGLVTDASSKDTQLRLEKTGLLPFFAGIVTFDQVGVKKPAPEPFLSALGMIGCAPKKTLMIGDSPHRDIEPCRSLGIRTVYARYGDRFSHDRGRVPADFVIDRMEDLLEIVDRRS